MRRLHSHLRRSLHGFGRLVYYMFGFVGGQHILERLPTTSVATQDARQWPLSLRSLNAYRSAWGVVLPHMQANEFGALTYMNDWIR